MTLSHIGSVLLLGCGKMGGAMLQGWLAQGLPPAHVVVLDPAPPPEIVDLLERNGVRRITSSNGLAVADVVIVAVKPQVMQVALPPAATAVGADTLVISIAAGKSVADLASCLPNGSRIIRAMPNTPSAVGCGITAGFAGPSVSAEQVVVADALLSASGATVWIEDEGLMDAVTAVSGSGPAYVFYLAECMAEAGVKAGLPPQIATQLARATVSGAGALMDASNLPASQLRVNVTSPNGTTAAALDVLMADDGLRPLLTEAVAAAKKRSEELSG